MSFTILCDKINFYFALNSLQDLRVALLFKTISLILIVTFLVFFCLFWNIRKTLKTYLTFQRYYLIIIWNWFRTLILQLEIMIFLMIFFQLQHFWTLYMLWLTNYLKNTYRTLTLALNLFFWSELIPLIIILWRTIF